MLPVKPYTVGKGSPIPARGNAVGECRDRAGLQETPKDAITHCGPTDRKANPIFATGGSGGCRSRGAYMSCMPAGRSRSGSQATTGGADSSVLVKALFKGTLAPHWGPPRPADWNAGKSTDI
jgi:hypothetical protein